MEGGRGRTPISPSLPPPLSRSWAVTERLALAPTKISLNWSSGPRGDVEIESGVEESRKYLLLINGSGRAPHMQW